MGAFSVRRYRPGDAEQVRTLHETAMRAVDTFAEDVPDDDLNDVTGTYLTGDGEFLVGERGGDVVAMGALKPLEKGAAAVALGVAESEADTAEVTRMRVHPEHWRQGYGSAVLARLEARAPELGYDRLVLDTGAHQTGAQAFYEANGYAEAGSGEFYGYALVVYGKDLGTART
jgi:GNAT superfamily N-acetyltransferase